MAPSQTMTCPQCGNVVAATDQFCPKCYARLEPPGFWRRLLSSFKISVQLPGVPQRPRMTVKKTVNIQTTDGHGVRHVYHSLEEMPPELRADIEKLQSEAMSEPGDSTSVTETSPAGDVTTSLTSIEKKVSLYKIRDASGNEQIYHSLDEMPPDVRAAVEKARDKTD